MLHESGAKRGASLPKVHNVNLDEADVLATIRDNQEDEDIKIHWAAIKTSLEDKAKIEQTEQEKQATEERKQAMAEQNPQELPQGQPRVKK